VTPYEVYLKEEDDFSKWGAWVGIPVIVAAIAIVGGVAFLHIRYKISSPICREATVSKKVLFNAMGWPNSRAPRTVFELSSNGESILASGGEKDFLRADVGDKVMACLKKEIRGHDFNISSIKIIKRRE